MIRITCMWVDRLSGGIRSISPIIQGRMRSAHISTTSIAAQISLALSELKGKNLICWCAPLECHADILLRLANEEDNVRE